MSKEEMNDELFNLDESKSASTFLSDKPKTDDGLLRPKLEEGRDGKRELVIRLLPNLQQDGKLGPTALAKHIHYANFPEHPTLGGYFDCLKNEEIGKDCPLCAAFWNLKNSKIEANENKARKINRSTKYYAYAYVVEDEQVPENEGKIFIYPFGYKIYQKIKAQAESKRKPIKVEDLIHGANLNLIIEEIGSFYNYDASHFEAPGPLEIDGQEIPVNEDGTISNKTKKKVVEFLMTRETEVETFKARDWSPEQYDKADKIVAILLGQPYTGESTAERPHAKTEALSSADVFDEEDDDDDDERVEVEEVEEVEEEKQKPKATKSKSKSKAKKVEFDDGDDDDDNSNDEDSEDEKVKNAKSKAAAFFDED